MITFTQKGDFSLTSRWLHRMSTKEFLNKLDMYGQAGVEALASATPKDTGTTAASWTYKVVKPFLGTARIEWHNTNINKGVPIAVIIQYGHGTGSGAYVEGVDYINPAIKPVFNDIANHIWEEVVKE